MALASAGHEVEKIEVSGPASHLVSRLEASDPDLIFNTAEGRRGRAREAFYPALFEELGFPYTGSDAYALTLTLDKWLTKLVLATHGVDSPRGRLVAPAELARVVDSGIALSYPVIVKPNYEGSSKGITQDSVVEDPLRLVFVEHWADLADQWRETEVGDAPGNPATETGAWLVLKPEAATALRSVPNGTPVRLDAASYVYAMAWLPRLTARIIISPD